MKRGPATSHLPVTAAAVWTVLLLLNYAVRAVAPDWAPGSLWQEARLVATFDPVVTGARLLEHLRALLTAGLVVLGGLGLGRAGVAWTGFACTGSTLPLATLAGLGLAGLGVFGLGFAGLLHPAVLAAAAALAGLAGAAGLARATVTGGPARHAGAMRVLRWCVIVAAAGWVLSAMAPETEMDSLKYHLGKPQQYLLAGKIATNRSVFFKFPSLWEALLTAPMALDGPVAAKLVQPAVVLLTALLLASALGPAAPCGGRLAAGLLLTSYAISRLAVTAKNDVLVAAFGLGAFAAWLTARPGRRQPGLLLAGLLLGLALATKYTALLSVAVVLAAIGASWLPHPRPRRAVRDLAWLGAGLGAGYVPWGMKLWLETRNPVYPFAAGFFGAGMYPRSYALLAIETHRYVNASYDTLADRLRAVWNLAMVEHLWLLPALAVPGLMVLLRPRAPGRAWLVGGAIATGLWTVGPPQARYLLQGITLLCGAIEWSVAGLAAWGRPTHSVGLAGGDRLRRFTLAVLVAITAGESLRGWGDYWSDRGSRLPVALGLLNPGAYELDKLTTYADATRWIEEHTPPRSHVLIFGPTRTFPLARRSTLRTDYEPFPPLALAAESLDDEHLARKMRQAGYSHLLFERLNAVAWGEQMAVILPPDQALARWAAWWRRHAVEVYESPRFDLRQGAFVVFELDGRAHAGPPPLFLPGVEGWLYPPAELLRQGRVREARASFDRVRAVAGDIPFIRQAEVALFESRLPRTTARRILKEVEIAGLRSVWLYTTLGRYAAQAGDPALAERYRMRADALAFRQIAAPEGGPNGRDRWPGDPGAPTGPALR